ncbi:MAG: tetratricopeptide repeat protein, partial [Bilophila sp.]
QITDLHFSSAHSSMDSWCTVAIGEGQLQTAGSIPILVAGQLILGDKAGCFYCGARSHDSVDCPTKRMKLVSGDVWKEFGPFPLDSINEGFRIIEKTLEKNGLAGYADLMDDLTLQGRLMRTIFEIDLPLQLRIIERLWQTSGREFPSGAAELELAASDTLAKDDSPAWGLLERLSKLRAPDLPAFEKDVLALVARTPRDHRLRALLGFSAMERGDLAKAQTCWREAESLASSSLYQAWYMLLLGRLLEMQGRPSEASDMYQGVLRLCPQWQTVEYRQVVCRVKMGFTEQIQPRIHQMVEQDPTVFNRFLIDPELERGHLLILTSLYPYWADSKRQAEDEKVRIDELLKQVDDWFPPEHLVARKIRQRLVNLAEQISIANYLAFLSVVRTRPSIEKDLTSQIQQEIEDLKGRFKNYLSILEIVRDEAAWFPFPRVLVEFNRDFNECAGIINWAFGSNFHESESFKRAQGYVPTIVDLLSKLEKRLKFLRVVRDSTLFVLILGRTFFWVEVAGLVLCIIGVPTIAVFGNDFGMGWLKTLIRNNHWELQKVLLAILSVMALGISALRTTLVFEKRRDQLVSDARAQREEMQRLRLERVKETVRLKEERGHKTQIHQPFGGTASVASAPPEKLTLEKEEKKEEE